MRLYFLRHAEAIDGIDDAARPLSPKGRQQSRDIARFLQAAGIALDAAYSSPLVRARQTAEIVLGVCGSVKPDQLVLADALLNETSPREFEEWLRTIQDSSHVLLVGHAPSLGSRVRSLIGVACETGFDLPKGGLACVKTNDGREGELKFFVTPKALGL